MKQIFQIKFRKILNLFYVCQTPDLIFCIFECNVVYILTLLQNNNTTELGNLANIIKIEDLTRTGSTPPGEGNDSLATLVIDTHAGETAPMQVTIAQYFSLILFQYGCGIKPEIPFLLSFFMVIILLKCSSSKGDASVSIGDLLSSSY